MPLKSTNLGQIVPKGVIAYLWTSTVKNHQGDLGKNLCKGKISKSNLTFGGKGIDHASADIPPFKTLRPRRMQSGPNCRDLA